MLMKLHKQEEWEEVNQKTTTADALGDDPYLDVSRVEKPDITGGKITNLKIFKYFERSENVSRGEISVK